jgi:DNA-binding SARP family transcriptional activator/tetratricopeptide (TPR) repeat protein
MRMRLVTLGSCRLEDDLGRGVNVPAVSLIMLAYVHHRQAPVSRRELAELFWPDGGEAAATNLRSMLRRFSMVFANREACPLVIGPGEVELRRGLLDCDLPDFEQEEDDLGARLRSLSDAVSRGFLPLHAGRPGRIGRWIAEIHLALVGQLRKTLLAVAAIDRQAGSHRADMKRAALLLLEEDPHDEAVRKMLSSVLDHHRSLQIQAGRVASPVKDLQASAPAARERLPRLALLPPEISSGIEGSGFVANALIEDLTIGLCASRSVSVVAPYTAEKIRASGDKASLLRQHHVLYALDTRRSGEWLFAQLIFLPSDEVVWATRFRLEPSETAQQRLKIADAIQTSIVERMRMAAAPVESFRATPEAYFAYLSGLQSLAQLSLPSLRRARKHFRDALRHDSGLAAALAGLSRTLSLEWVLTARGDEELLAEAERFAKRAIEIDDSSATAFKELGVSQLYKGSIDDSLAALAEAERLGPHFADAIFSHADSLTHAGQPGAALDKLNLAISLNPMPPDTYYWAAAGASYFLRDFEQALSFIDCMQDKKPATRLAAACFGMLGDQARARIHRNRFLADNPAFKLEQWLSMVPHKESWQAELYREGLNRAGFKGE